MTNNTTKKPHAGKGVPKSTETKRRMSEAGKRKVFTDEHRANMSKAQVGKVHSAESAAKTNTANKKKISIDGVIHKGIQETAAKLGITPKVLAGRLNSPKYPTWFRVENSQ